MSAPFADDREEIFRRLRGEQGAETTVTPAPLTPPAMPGPPAAADLTATFAAAAKENQSDVVRIDSLDALPATVAAYLREQNAPPQVLCEDAFMPLPWQQAQLTADCRAPQQEDSCGVTGIIAAAANNGVFLLADNTPHRLTLSLTPPYHVAVVPESAIEPDLPAVWQRLPQPQPRGCVLVAGPSRTADIEQTLTLGAHGPIRVLVVIVNNQKPPAAETTTENAQS